MEFLWEAFPFVATDYPECGIVLGLAKKSSFLDWKLTVVPTITILIYGWATISLRDGYDGPDENKARGGIPCLVALLTSGVHAC
jgi:hypothetical protein